MTVLYPFYNRFVQLYRLIFKQNVIKIFQLQFTFKYQILSLYILGWFLFSLHLLSKFKIISQFS